LHPRRGYNPEDIVYVHVFEPSTVLIHRVRSLGWRGSVKLSVRDRILLHPYRYEKYPDEHVVPTNIT
jgi:hypothetical protein